MMGAAFLKRADTKRSCSVFPCRSSAVFALQRLKQSQWCKYWYVFEVNLSMMSRRLHMFDLCPQTEAIGDWVEHD
jgi:hypothetical protein